MAKYQFITFRFNRPNELVQTDYEILKDVFIENIKYNINPPSNFFETFKYVLLIFGIGIISSVIALIGINIGLEWLNGVFGFLSVLCLVACIGGLPGFISFLWFIFLKNRYYKKLKRDIIKSKNYNEFINIRDRILI